MSSGQIVDMTNVVVNLPIGLSRFKVKVKLWNVLGLFCVLHFLKNNSKNNVQIWNHFQTKAIFIYSFINEYGFGNNFLNIFYWKVPKIDVKGFLSNRHFLLRSMGKNTDYYDQISFKINKVFIFWSKSHNEWKKVYSYLIVYLDYL
jgi:hypothetical protein